MNNFSLMDNCNFVQTMTINHDERMFFEERKHARFVKMILSSLL